MKIVFTIAFALLLALQVSAELTVFAAASTTDAMEELASKFEENGGEKIRFNFASSGTLARQIEAGAPADVFVSANAQWMDYLEAKNAIDKTSRFNAMSNSLVLIAPLGSTLAFDGKIPGRLAVGDFNSVPAGMYAREALGQKGWLDALRPKLVMGSNVRTVLMYVERGEVSAGIVYATDAIRSEKVEIVGTFPEESHSPIVYPVAACTGKPETAAFLAFLKSPEAKAILKSNGFK